MRKTFTVVLLDTFANVFSIAVAFLITVVNTFSLSSLLAPIIVVLLLET
jgi:hypothetical protein